MKYCFYCGKQVDKNAKVCTHCLEDISNSEEKKKYDAFVECIKCGSTNVEYSIVKRNKKGIVYEEQVYTCKECGKEFRDKNRMGYSFNNAPQIILGENSKKIIKILIFIIVFIFVLVKLGFFETISSSRSTTYDYVQNCNGLQTVKLADIYHAYQNNKESAIEMYVDKPFIFEGKIFRIDSDKTMLQMDSEEISPEIYINIEERYKLDNYKAGDTIRVCGILKNKKTILSVPIFVENATIIN